MDLFGRMKQSRNDNSNPEENPAFSQKRYLGILDSYDVSWSLEKAARDTLQNFFDSNNQTLDGVDISVTKEGFTDYQVRIQNHATYDFRRLLHLGGTTKGDNSFSAGGVGEGAKILALVLLRDYGFSQVKFGSQDWVVDFSMDKIPKGDYVERRKGLFAKCSRASEPIEGNFVELRTDNKENTQVFEDARDLFYHSENPDFANPTLEVEGVGGFSFLDPRKQTEFGDKSDEVPKGNFYFAGQRRHLAEEKWNNVEYVSIWTWDNRGLKRDRDRGLVTKKEFYDGVVMPMVKSAERDELERVLYELEPIWTESSVSEECGPVILESIANELRKQKVKLKFDDKYVAYSFGCCSYTNALEALGYVICNSSLSNVGMITANDRIKILGEHQRVKPSEGDKEKIEILYNSIRPFYWEPKEIRLFDRDSGKNVIHGQDDKRFVWMAREALNTTYPEAFSTYLQELDRGNNQNQEFSYALTKTLGQVIRHMTRQPEIYQALENRWKDI